MLGRALARGEDDALLRVGTEDNRVDQAELEVDELAISVLLSFSPVAKDLRRVLAIAKSARELERAGDEAKRGARYVSELADTERRPALDEPLARVACLVAEQIERACRSLVELDVALARHVVATDRAVNEQVRALHATTLALDAPVAALFPYLTLERSIERGGDHAKVIAKLALGAATGVEARHERTRGGST